MFDAVTENNFNQVFSGYTPKAGDTCGMSPDGGRTWVDINVEAHANGKMTGFIKGERFAMLTNHIRFREIK